MTRLIAHLTETGIHITMPQYRKVVGLFQGRTHIIVHDYYQQYAKAIAALSKDDVLRVARKYIDIDRMAIVIVGDRAAIEGPLGAANIAPIEHLDIEGEPKP
jgi:hypothetical protein